MTADWKKIVQPYAVPSTLRSVVQVVTTFAGMVGAEVAANWFIGRSIPAVVLCNLLAAGFLVRLFIFQHDCGHGSFLANRRAQDTLGMLFGFLMFTPYDAWRREHSLHHAGTGDLERRGHGDINMLTVAEYAKLSPLMKLGYRLFRNPIILFCIGPTMLFVIGQRFPILFGKDLDARVRSSVHKTNLGGLLVFAAVYALGGWQALLLVHLPAAIVACSFGVVLFYVQHQYERPYWRHHDDWDFVRASLEGSSYLKLPRILRYFSGNIGIHHIHHLAPQIPNYNLQACLDENPSLAPTTTVGLWGAIKTVGFKLYDEPTGVMVDFKVAHRLIEERRTTTEVVDAPVRLAA